MNIYISTNAVPSVRSAGNVTVITRDLPRNLRLGKIEKLCMIYAYFLFIFLQIGLIKELTEISYT